jgi:hypothetical protein
LEEDPQTRSKEGHRPGDEDEEKDPKESKARVTGHLDEEFGRRKPWNGRTCFWRRRR